MGLPGAQGVAGVTGATGGVGPAGLPGLTYQGTYGPVSNYKVGDVVLWNGASYASLTAGNHGNTPDASPPQWGVLSQQGPAGMAGVQGVQGVGGPQGSPGSVGPPGDHGPQGLQGIAGQAGAQGIPGVAGAGGPQGSIGPGGPAGPTGLSFRGTYAAGTNYGLGDGVMYGGAGYVSLGSSNRGNTPDGSPQQWAMFAAAGSNGGNGVAGATGAQGVAGLQGPQGAIGQAGPVGANGPQGPAVANYTGSYSAGTNYGLNDAVSYGGSTYISMVPGNRGNTPDGSPGQWAILVARGAPGTPGATGAAGAAGQTGAMGAAGATGQQGPPVSFSGGWSVGRVYAVGDAAGYGGSSYVVIAANSGRQPDMSPVYWALLAQSGATGASGPAGAQGAAGPTGVGAQGPMGAQGQTGVSGGTGPAGVAGSTGLTGPIGAAGPAGVAGIAGMAYQGSYLSTKSYGRNDAVSYQGSTYLSVVASNLGNSPDGGPAFWSVFAAAGLNGVAGAAGGAGAQGPPGIQGTAGQQGATGLSGAAGVNGAAGLRYVGAFSAAVNYALNDGVVYGGSTYTSIAAGNRGNSPDLSPSWWGLLAQAGASGVGGPTGPAGPAGPTGAAGGSGATGAMGATGRAGMVYRGGWNSPTNYGVGDAVLFQGTTYLAEMSNSASEPDLFPGAWSVLAQQGSAGPTGPGGAAATVQIGSVTTGAAGGAATVTNTGTAGSAVLNFSIPQGAAGVSGTGGGTGGASTSGIAFQSVYHAVSFNALYYSVNNSNAGQSESGGSMLTWVPVGCTATKLTMYSQQANAITVTLRQGMPGAMANTTMACTATSNSSCTATGNVVVGGGTFVDLNMSGSNGVASGVWTALACN